MTDIELKINNPHNLPLVKHIKTGNIYFFLGFVDGFRPTVMQIEPIKSTIQDTIIANNITNLVTEMGLIEENTPLYGINSMLVDSNGRDGIYEFLNPNDPRTF